MTRTPCGARSPQHPHVLRSQAVQGRGGVQEQEALGGDGCMELEGGVIADDSDDGA